MKEKQAFIFFVSDSPHDWERNREIFSLYLNRITVDESDECEVISIEEVDYLDNATWENNSDWICHQNWVVENNQDLIRRTLQSYQEEIKEGIASKLHCIQFTGFKYMYWYFKNHSRNLG